MNRVTGTGAPSVYSTAVLSVIWRATLPIRLAENPNAQV